MSLSDLCSSAPILLDTETATENAAIQGAVALLHGHADVLNSAAFLSSVLERQLISPPLLGGGIALPHARCSHVREVVMAIARTRESVSFGPDATPVRLIFLYGIPPHRVAEHLATTAALARKLRDPSTVQALLDAPDADSFRRLLV